MHAASPRWLFHARCRRLRRTELLLLLAHVLAYPARSVGIAPIQAVAFVAVHQAVFGLYMGCSFAPNHKGMPIIGAEQKLDYLRHQVVTSRKCARRLVRRPGARRTELPDRTPPVPEHAPLPPAQRPNGWCRPTARNTRSPTPRPACSPPTRARCATCTHSANRCERRTSPGARRD